MRGALPVPSPSDWLGEALSPKTWKCVNADLGPAVARTDLTIELAFQITVLHVMMT